MKFGQDKRLSEAWPGHFVRKAAFSPDDLSAPLLVMFFNLECAACVSRAVPLFKRFQKIYAGRLASLLVHTAYAHRAYPAEDVLPQLAHFYDSFARLQGALALDLSGSLAKNWGAEGTPHWFVFAPDGELRLSVYGSQGGAQTRLEYALESLLGT